MKPRLASSRKGHRDSWVIWRRTDGRREKRDGQAAKRRHVEKQRIDRIFQRRN